MTLHCPVCNVALYPEDQVCRRCLTDLICLHAWDGGRHGTSRKLLPRAEWRRQEEGSEPEVFSRKT